MELLDLETMDIFAMSQFLKTKNISSKIFSYYQDYFHDGGIENITSLNDEIIFEMQSAQIFKCDNRDNLPLSEEQTIYGNLHAKGIISIMLNNQLVNSLKMEYDHVSLIELEISNNRVSFCGNWKKYGGKVPYENEMFVCEVIAKELYWENTANITDPKLFGKYMGLDGPPPYPYPQWYIDKYGPQEDED